MNNAYLDSSIIVKTKPNKVSSFPNIYRSRILGKGRNIS